MLRAVDAAPADPPAYHLAAPTALAPRDAEERRLCNAAASKLSDPYVWLYGVPLLAMNVGAIALDSNLKYADDSSVRALGPSAVGLAWGALIGGGYLLLPKCDPHFVSYTPAEGDVRPSWPLAIVLAVLAGATAPVVVGIETGGLPPNWTTEERVTRLVLAGTTGFVGALLPYLLPPRSWRAAKKLEKLRLGASATGAIATLSFSF
jgi:hypothetical protein